MLQTSDFHQWWQSQIKNKSSSQFLNVYLKNRLLVLRDNHSSQKPTDKILKDNSNFYEIVCAVCYFFNYTFLIWQNIIKHCIHTDAIVTSWTRLIFQIIDQSFINKIRSLEVTQKVEKTRSPW